MNRTELNELLNLLDNSLVIEDSKVIIKDRTKLQATIYRLAEVSALESGVRQGLARYITRLAALAFGAYPASIQDLYLARGRGELPHTFTVPAINLRMLSFDAAKAVFRGSGETMVQHLSLRLPAQKWVTPINALRNMSPIFSQQLSAKVILARVYPGRPLSGIRQTLRKHTRGRGPGSTRPDQRSYCSWLF
jgi:hypothetical protein